MEFVPLGALPLPDRTAAPRLRLPGCCIFLLGHGCSACAQSSYTSLLWCRAPSASCLEGEFTALTGLAGVAHLGIKLCTAASSRLVCGASSTSCLATLRYCGAEFILRLAATWSSSLWAHFRCMIAVLVDICWRYCKSACRHLLRVLHSVIALCDSVSLHLVCGAIIAHTMYRFCYCYSLTEADFLGRC
jgi:hypothetical protein